jgi:hypothetical protein
VGVDLHMAVSSEGAVVAAIELGDQDPTFLISAARERGAELLWVHANIDLSHFGFKRASGYARLQADFPPEGYPLASR